MANQAKVFLSYASEDAPAVEELHSRLIKEGHRPWMDTQDILPGQVWRQAISKSIRSSDIFLACLSRRSVNKRGLLQKELREALEVWDERPHGDIFLIPVKLEECDVPEPLQAFQWLDLAQETAWSRLLRALELSMERQAAIDVDASDLGDDAKFLAAPLPDSSTPSEQPSRTGMSLNVSLDTEHRIAVVRTDGYINNQGGEALAETIYGLTTLGYNQAVLNLGRTKIVNSIGISILVEIIETFLEIKGNIVFSDLTDTVTKTFIVMGLSQYSEIYETEDLALKSLLAQEASG